MIEPSRLRRLLLSLLAACALGAAVPALSRPVAAQEPGRFAGLAVSDTLYEVRLAGGESYLGRIVQVAGDRVTLESESGTRVELSRAQISSLRPARGRMVNGVFWHEDPNRTRLYFSPTARSIRAGTGYVGVYELFVPFVGYGFTDRVSIAGGSPFYLGLGSGVTPPVYVAPKVQVLSGPRVQGAVGALALMIPEDTDHVYGILYGVLTAGSADNAVTGGVGWGYVNDEISPSPVVMLGGERRVSRSIKLLTENMFVPGDEGVIFSGGVRFFGERLSADLGLGGFSGDGLECCLPVVNVVWNFGPLR